MPGTSRREDWCAAFVNDALGTGMGDSYENKLGKAKERVPTAGMFFVQPTDSIYGHTGIVESVDLANGTMDVVEANWQKGADGKGIISRRTMDISDAGGFGKPPNGLAVGKNTVSGFNLDTVEGKMAQKYDKIAINSGLKGKAKEEFTQKRIEDSYKAFTEVQSKAHNAYTMMAPENERFDTAYDGLTADQQEDLADDMYLPFVVI